MIVAVWQEFQQENILNEISWSITKDSAEELRVWEWKPKASIPNPILEKTVIMLFYIILYVNSHHWVGVTRISDNLRANKMLIDITRIRPKSPALNLIWRGNKKLSA